MAVVTSGALGDDSQGGALVDDAPLALASSLGFNQAPSGAEHGEVELLRKLSAQ